MSGPRVYIGKHPCDDQPYIHDVDPDPRSGDPMFTLDGPDYSGWYVREADILEHARSLGAVVANPQEPDYEAAARAAREVFRPFNDPGGSVSRTVAKAIVDAAIGNRLLVDPEGLEDDAMPDGRSWMDEGEREEDMR